MAFAQTNTNGGDIKFLDSIYNVNVAEKWSAGWDRSMVVNLM